MSMATAEHPSGPRRSGQVRRYAPKPFFEGKGFERADGSLWVDAGRGDGTNGPVRVVPYVEYVNRVGQLEDLIVRMQRRVLELERTVG
jgi:hypothetical protein